MVELAKAHDVLPVAIVLDVPESVAVARNEGRPDRDFGSHVVRRQHDQLRRSLKGLARERDGAVSSSMPSTAGGESIPRLARSRSRGTSRRGSRTSSGRAAPALPCPWPPGRRLSPTSTSTGSAPATSSLGKVDDRPHPGARPRPLAPGTIKTRFVNVRSVFRAAVRDGMIAADPTASVRLPRQRKRGAAMTIPSPEVVRRILDAADPLFRAFVGLCAFAGLRLGAAAALRVEDVDSLRRQIQVSRQVQRPTGGELDIRLPKYNSERTVHVPDALVEILAQHVEQGLLCPWLFAGVDLQPPHQNTIGYRWRTTLARAGVEGIQLHDLRHFFASGLIASGCDVVAVQRALGHAKSTTTLTTYAHLWPTAEDRVRDASARLVAEALGSGEGTVRADEA